MRGHEHGVLGRDTCRNRLADHPVDVARVGDVLGIAIVRAEGDAPRAVLLHQRQQRVQVARHRRLADEQPHPGPQALAPLLHRERFVVRVDAGGRVCLELAPEESGRMPVDMASTVERELLEFAGSTGDDAGEVHHLRETEHPAPAHQRLEVTRRQRSPRRLERRRGHA